MRKLYLAVAIIMLIALLIPAGLASADTTTSVTVSSGGGGIPVVKAKWEQEAGCPQLESGDPTHSMYESQYANSQFAPPMVKCAQKTIQYLAVVTDEENQGNVQEVFSYVYHPVNSPAPYDYATKHNTNDPAITRGFKYKVVYTRIDDNAVAATVINAANAAHLIYFAPDYDISELTGENGEITKGTAKLWVGTEVIDYEQPAGDYLVRCFAVDTNNNYSAVLENRFNYVPTSGIEADFSGIVYGSVNLKEEKMVAGDWVWGSGLAGEGQTNKATLRNIGNTWAALTVRQDDMTFDKAGSAAGTALQSPSPLGAASNWNVNFDVRLGSKDTNRRYYDPFVTVTTPNYLGLSTIEELDLSILVKNGSGTHTGTITLGSVIVPFTASPALLTGAADPC